MKELYLIGHRKQEHPIKTKRLPEFEAMVHGIDYYKIGVAEDPDKRLTSLKTGTPHLLELVTTVKSDEPNVVEEMLHGYNRLGHKKGEWFWLHSDFVESMKGLDFLSKDTLESVIEKEDHERLQDRSFQEKVYALRDTELPAETNNGDRIIQKGGLK